MAVAQTTMTDEQRKSVALEYLKAFDNGGVTSTGDSILSLFASDGRPDQEVKFGNQVHLSLQGDDVSKLTNAFDGLSAGGHVDMPLAKQFWGDTFGMLTDKFGMHWMVNISGRGSE